MARTNQRRISDINDMFIYQSGKNYVYCGPFSKKGYIVTNDNARAYTLFASRYILAITVLLFLALTTGSIKLKYNTPAKLASSFLDTASKYVNNCICTPATTSFKSILFKRSFNLWSSSTSNLVAA